MYEDRLKYFNEQIRVIRDGGDCNLNRQFITKSTTISSSHASTPVHREKANSQQP